MKPRNEPETRGESFTMKATQKEFLLEGRWKMEAVTMNSSSGFRRMIYYTSMVEP